MKKFSIAAAAFLCAALLFSLCFNADAAEHRTKKLPDGGPTVTLNHFVAKDGAKMPEKGISFHALQAAWNKLHPHTKFDAFLIYDDADTKNAFIMMDKDGEYIVTVYRGLMEIFTDENEIAGVLAHEVGHGVRNHIAKMQNNMAGISIGVQILSSLLGNSSLGGAIGGLAAQIGASLAINGYSREAEVEADDYSVEYTAKSGYSAWGLYDSIVSMSKNGMVTPPSGFNSHPPTERRMEHIKAQAERWERELGVASRTHKPTVQPEPEPQPEPEKKTAPKPETKKPAPKSIPAPIVSNTSDGEDVIASYGTNEATKEKIVQMHREAMNLYNNGRYDEAMRAFGKASNVYLGDYLNELWAGRAAERMDDKRNMRKWVNRSLISNPDYEPAKQFKAKHFGE